MTGVVCLSPSLKYTMQKNFGGKAYSSQLQAQCKQAKKELFCDKTMGYRCVIFVA